MTPLPLWADIEPAPSKPPRRRPGRALIRAAEAFAGAVCDALADSGAAIERRGRLVRVEHGPRRFAIVVRCVE